MKRKMFYQIVKRKFYLFFMLLLVLINFSCKSDDDYVTNTDNEISVNSLSGEDIFKGIFFLEGDISKNIPHLKSLKEVYDKQLKKSDNYENQKKEISYIENKIVNQMKSIEPDFFGKFRDTITSNNPLVTETAIKRTSSLFIDALYSDIELKPYLVNSEFLLKKLDNSKIMNRSNGIDPVKLENELN